MDQPAVMTISVEMEGNRVLQRALDQAERTLIEKALVDTSSRKAAAELLGISLRSLYYKMRRLDMPTTRGKLVHN